MSGMTASPHGQQMSSPRDYAPQIKLEQPLPPTSAHAHAHSQAPSLHQHQLQPQPATSSVPNVLQPGGMSSRPQAMSVNTAPTLPTMHASMPPPASSSASSQHHHQHQPPPPSHDYQTPSKPSLTMPHSHTYSRSSPAAGYDGPPTSYHAYTPTTPSGSSSQFMSPADIGKYNAPGSQRNFSTTPLGLADIRPRADSSMSDGAPGTIAHDLANAQPGPSNYLAPWAIYAFDWCKWPPQGNGAGKLAVGSYLEDGHNFVSPGRVPVVVFSLLTL